MQQSLRSRAFGYYFQATEPLTNTYSRTRHWIGQELCGFDSNRKGKGKKNNDVIKPSSSYVSISSHQAKTRRVHERGINGSRIEELKGGETEAQEVPINKDVI